MKEDLGVGIPLDIVCRIIELLYYSFLLGDPGYAVEPICKILFGFRQIDIITHQSEPDGLFKKMIEITKELFLLLAAETAGFFNPFCLRHRACFYDRIEPFT